jgi:5'-3' exonuclease
MWAAKRGVNVNFFIFFESGHSVYHLNIDKTYKCSRKIASVYGVDVSYQEEFFQILHSNLQLIEKACNGLPNVYVLRLHNLECDFLPYYLLTRASFGKNPDQLNILYSNDKDMWQTVSENTFIFSKIGKVKNLITPGGLMTKFLKRECNIDDSYFTIVKAIWGDAGDDIDGVKGVGPVGIIELFPEFQPMIGSIEDVYDNIQNHLPIFNVIPSKIENKKLKSVIDAELTSGLISNNLKLISFELLSRAVDDPIESKMNERKEHLKKSLNEKEVIKLNVMSETLKRFNVTLDEDALASIYHL